MGHLAANLPRQRVAFILYQRGRQLASSLPQAVAPPPHKHSPASPVSVPAKFVRHVEDAAVHQAGIAIGLPQHGRSPRLARSDPFCRRPTEETIVAAVMPLVSTPLDQINSATKRRRERIHTRHQVHEDWKARLSVVETTYTSLGNMASCFPREAKAIPGKTCRAGHTYLSEEGAMVNWIAIGKKKSEVFVEFDQA